VPELRPEAGFIQNSRVIPPIAAVGMGTLISEAVEVKLTLLANGLVATALTVTLTLRVTDSKAAVSMGVNVTS
jgi:hypothetical protein